jgi:purine nucleosidase
MRPNIKLLLDTDPGSDIDDAICIAYLLSHPQCELLGITTVTGMPELRCKIASAVCEAYGRSDMPIFPGAGRPLVRDTHQRDVPHGEALPNWHHRTEFPSGEAIRFMRDTILAHPGEVELLAIGALTNVALLFRTYPETVSAIRGLTVMGGRFMLGAPVGYVLEHNIICDPHAAAATVRTEVPALKMVGLDVTLQVTQTKEEIARSFGAEPKFAPILDMAGTWFKFATALCYHDIVAAATVFEPDLCGFRRGRISVELGTGLEAFTHFQEDPEGPHEVAATVDRTAFLDHFCSITGCAPV